MVRRAVCLRKVASGVRIWLSCETTRLKTLKNGCPGLRFRQWALLLDSSQAFFGTGKL